MTPGCPTALIGLLSSPADTSLRHLPLQLRIILLPPPETRLPHSSYPGRCSSTAASLQAKLQCRKGRAFILFFIPPEAFVEVSQSQGKIPLPGLPAQHPGKFLQPSLEQHLWATLITGRELESAQMSLTTLWFVREPNQTARVVRASPRRCTA